MISLKHENGPGSNAWDGELHNFGWLDDFYEKEKTVECGFNIFLWKPVLFWPQTILYLQIHYLGGMFSGQGWLKDGSRSRWNVTSLYYPLECNILVLSIGIVLSVGMYHPCIIHPLSPVFWRRQYLSLDERQQWEGWSNASHCPQVPRHPTT